MKLSKYSWSDSEVNNGHFCSEIVSPSIQMKTPFPPFPI